MPISKAEWYGRVRKQQALFSRHILGVPLYEYQCEFTQKIIEAVRDKDTQTFVVEMSRQSGKNEASAHLELNLLAQNRSTGGSIVKAAPTFRPQVVTSKARLVRLATSAAQKYKWMTLSPAEGYIFRNGKADISFFSADKKSNVVGATASALLEIDEAQDVDEDKMNLAFNPMRASTGASLVLYGTTWTSDTLLEKTKQQILEGRTKGQVFRILPERIGESNPEYLRYVEQQIALLGIEHPAIRTQYRLLPLENQGRVFSKQQIVQMMGIHNRKESRENETIIVGGLDWAGSEEDAGKMASMSKIVARDSVALTIATVDWIQVMAGVLEPRIKVLARYEWTNVHPLSLQSTLFELLQNKWKVNRVVSDATGIGATGSMLLGKSIDNNTNTRFTTRTFDAAWRTQTELASQFIALVNGSRFLDYKSNNFNPLEESQRDKPNTSDPDAHVWFQRGHARLEARDSKRLRMYVPNQDGHDDLLVADMLACDAAISLGNVGEFKQTKRASFG